MARKKKLVEKEMLSVEVVVWHDAAGRDRKAPSSEPVIFRTAGMVLAETETELVLAYDIVAVDDYLDDDHKEDAVTTNIPLLNIIERIRFGEVPTAMSREGWKLYVERVQKVSEALRTSEVLPVDGPGTGTAQQKEP